MDAPTGNLEALNRLLASRAVEPAVAALARSLAASIDAAPEVGLAALAKEYRALLKELTSDAGGSDPADDWLRGLSAEMGDASPA